MPTTVYTREQLEAMHHGQLRDVAKEHGVHVGHQGRAALVDAILNDPPPSVDLSSLFPEWNAVATRDGSIATVVMTQPGKRRTLKLDIERMYQALHDLRRLGPQTKPR